MEGRQGWGAAAAGCSSSATAAVRQKLPLLTGASRGRPLSLLAHLAQLGHVWRGLWTVTA
jgi:hypothetical protein